MGMFDSVYFPCRTEGCEGNIEVQSKAGECVLASYSPESVPIAIAVDIAGESAWCRTCNRYFTVAKGVPDRVAVSLEGDPEPCGHCGK
jgi:hypothetical protein